MRLSRAQIDRQEGGLETGRPEIKSSKESLGPLPVAGPRLRWFIVEDSDAVRQTYLAFAGDDPLIEIAGWAETAESAISALETLQCDIVTIDLELREGHGFEVLRAIKKKNAPSSPVCAMLTSFSELELQQQARKLGADYYFEKGREFFALLSLLQIATKELADKRLQT